MTLYSTGCPKCRILEKKLDQLNIEYRICDDIDHIVEMEFTTVPILEDDQGNFMTFVEAYEYLSKLGRNEA